MAGRTGSPGRIVQGPRPAATPPFPGTGGSPSRRGREAYRGLRYRRIGRTYQEPRSPRPLRLSPAGGKTVSRGGGNSGRGNVPLAGFPAREEIVTAAGCGSAGGGFPGPCAHPRVLGGRMRNPFPSRPGWTTRLAGLRYGGAVAGGKRRPPGVQVLSAGCGLRSGPGRRGGAGGDPSRNEEDPGPRATHLHGQVVAKHVGSGGGGLLRWMYPGEDGPGGGVVNPGLHG